MLGKRKLGKQGLEVSEIGLGCMGMSFAYGQPDDKESIAVLHRAIELGCTFLDTAEAYGPFKNEELLGQVLKGRRDEVVLATKFGFDLEGGKPGGGLNSRPEHIRKVADECLRRLQTDHIDLFYQHRVDPAVPMEDVAGAVAELVAEGKVLYFGMSEAGVANLRKAHSVHPVSALQSEYSLWERNLEGDVLPAIRELGIGLVPFAPLGRGFLTGHVKRAEEYPETDYRHTDPRYMGENFDANMRAAEKVREVAAAVGATPAQVALAWLLAKGPDVVPIPGTKHVKYLEQNIAAASVALDAGQMKVLDEALAPDKISGPRYNPTTMSMVDR